MLVVCCCLVDVVVVVVVDNDMEIAAMELKKQWIGSNADGMIAVWMECDLGDWWSEGLLLLLELIVVVGGDQDDCCCCCCWRVDLVKASCQLLTG